MKYLQHSLIVASLALASSVATAVEFSGNVTLATDYVFRGFSQTDEKGAVQGGFDAGWDNGLYAGIWASNVNFGTEASTEMDYYVGYAFDLTDSVNLDLGYIYYDYEGDAEFDYQEVAATLGIRDLSFAVNYSDEYLGDGGPSAYILGADYSYSLAETTSLGFHIGYTEIDDMDAFDFEGDDNYVDYSVGITQEYEGFSFALTYVGTDLDDTDIADDRVVFSITRSL